MNTMKNLTKPLLVSFFFLSLIYLFRSVFSPTPQYTDEAAALLGTTTAAKDHLTPCSKIPTALAAAIIHYATSQITPQQTFNQILVTARVLTKRSPCNFLVFGLGHDSLMWAALNHGGRTVFLEEDEIWFQDVKGKFPSLEANRVKYDSLVSQADRLLEIGKSSQDCQLTVVEDLKRSKCPLVLNGLPSVFYDVEWDLIMLDAPMGYAGDKPGRMKAIYTAGMMARGRKKEGKTDVFVHDVDRPIEDTFSKTFLCEGYLKQEEGILRHFAIPSHRGSPNIPFCP